MPPTTEKRRLEFLDALRGLAAVYVVIFHVGVLPDPMLAFGPWAIQKFVYFGGTGVILFFIISGFSLSMTMPRHQASAAPNASYFINRVARIAPLFYFVMALTLLRLQLTTGRIPGVAHIAVDLGFLFNFAPGHQGGIVTASWTIGVEMVFYVLFPLLYRLGPKIKVAATVATWLLLMLVLVRFLSYQYVFCTFLGYIPIFLMGMIAFDIFETQRLTRGLAVLLLIGGAMLLAYCALPKDPNGIVKIRILIGLGYAAILLGCSAIHLPIVVNRVTTFYGKISYSLYLLHPLFVFTLIPVYRVLERYLPTGVAYPATLFITLIPATLAATLSYYFIEKPGIRLGRRLVQRISLERTAAAAA